MLENFGNNLPELIYYRSNLMKVFVEKDYDAVCRRGADIIEQVVRTKPDACIGLATGSSPVGMYKELARRCNEEGLDFSGCCSVNLDEYVGLEPNHPQSYRFFMDDNLFNHINIKKENTYVAKGVGDPEKNLAEFNARLNEVDIDVQVLGIGPDGHLGFNEPGTALKENAHMEVLKDSTIEANKRFFEKKEDVPTTAFTMGMGNIMKAKKLLMIISGKNKKDVAKQLLLTEDITCANPATFMRLHRDATVIIDAELAELIGYKA